MQQNLIKKQNFKLKLLEIKKSGMAHPGSHERVCDVGS